MNLLEKMKFFLKLLTNKRLRMDFKALKYASDGYVHYGLDLLRDLGVLEFLKKGKTLKEICEKVGVSHKKMLEHLLDFLVGRGILYYSKGQYKLKEIKDPFSKDELGYLKEHYPYSVKWNEHLVERAEKVLKQGGSQKGIGFDDENFAKIWDKMMDESPYSFKGIMIKKLLKDADDGDKIIDLACGSGSLLELIIKNIDKEIQLIGVDNSPKSLELAKERLRDLEETAESSLMKKNISNVVLKEQNLRKEFPENRFDYATTSLFFNHIPKEEMQNVIENINKLLKDGGEFGCYQLLHQSKFDRVPMWVMHLVPTHKDYPYRNNYFKILNKFFSEVESYFKGTISIAKK